jgi:hypothetical protein
MPPTNLRVKVDRYNIGFIISRDQGLFQVEAASFINTSNPFVIHVLIKSKHIIENSLSHENHGNAEM